ncbi:MAG: hypothetical protein K9L78_04910 [Victivallales bacterium]|nr:hypothetical protein [Victivallales bacterium]MCF7889443.1 hypothetical protein [Victivallales bacterium]
MEFDKLSNKVIGCAIKVHRTLGPGLMESKDSYFKRLIFSFCGAKDKNLRVLCVLRGKKINIKHVTNHST